jgi:hypothetical protein
VGFRIFINMPDGALAPHVMRLLLNSWVPGMHNDSPNPVVADTMGRFFLFKSPTGSKVIPI